MLASSKLQTIVCTSRLAEAEKFYSGVLGLPLKGTSHGALIYDVGGGFERIAGLPLDAAGILTTPDGAQVAWFRDPDGNLLSMVQYA